MKVWLVSENCSDNTDFIVGIFDSRIKAISSATWHYCNCEGIARTDMRVPKIREELLKNGYIPFPNDDEWFVSITEHEVR